MFYYNINVTMFCEVVIMISKKDLYKSLIYDLMMYGEDKEERQKSVFSALTDSYSYEVVSFIFENDDNYDLLDLKDVFPSEESFEKLKEYFEIDESKLKRILHENFV